MDCKEFERLIPDFIDRRMDYATLVKFNKHIESCEACKEELVIQFLVTEGIQRLEEGGTFDLQKELDLRLFETKKKIRFHSKFLRIGIVFEIVAVCLLIGIVLWIFL